MSAEVREGYKQTEVGVIPEDWDAARLHSLTTDIGDGLHGTPIYSLTGQYYFINGNNIDNGIIKFNSETKSVDYSEFKKHKNPLSARTILISINGTIGNLAYYNNESIILGKSAAYINIADGFSKQFVYFALQSLPVSRQFFDGLTGSTIGNLGLNTIRETYIALPPLPEQRAIASALADVDALLASLEALLTKKRHLKQAAMQELLTGKTRLEGYGGEWKRKKFEDVMDGFSSGATPFRGRKDYYTGDINWITSGELNYNVIDSTKERITPEAMRAANLNLLPSGTFLIAITGLEAAGTRGSCGIVGKPSASNQSCMALYPKSNLSLSFLFHHYCCFGETLAFEYCQGTKQQSYTGAIVKKLPIYLPENVSEQQAIASILSEMDAELDALAGRVTKTRQLKQGMMQELLTGRTRLV